jgi:hypothetical protein
MRGFDCHAPDGTHDEPEHFEGDDDEEIYRKTQAHIAEYHAELAFSEEQHRAMIANQAYNMPSSRA